MRVFLNAHFKKIFKTTDFDPINIKFPSLNALLQITESFKVQKGFIDILIFDALIGNCDRHSENWGLVGNTNSDGLKNRLAPAYDNAASLSNGWKISNR